MEEHSHIETVCFIVMGLSILAVFKALFAIAETSCYWIIAEGVCYITGTLFYSFRHIRYMHSVFHFFVLAGSACHLVAIWHVLEMLLQR
jgi:hemolysin III